MKMPDIENIIYFEINHAIFEHDRIIELTGGLSGISFEGLNKLQSIVGFIRNDLYYSTFVKKLNHLVFSLIKIHPFLDGNKRSSIVLGAFFLEINGFKNHIGKFIIEMENLTLHVAENRVDKEFLEVILNDIIPNGEISENTKFRLIKLIQEN